jgi:SH3-like domain-containing protein
MRKSSRPSTDAGRPAPLLTLLGALLLALVAAAPAAAADRVSVEVPVANVRSGPGTGNQVLWKVEKFHPLEVIQRSGKWIEFRDYEGDRAWIYTPLVSETDAVIVRRDNCNVRSGPGTDNPVQFVAERGVPFRVLERNGNWIHIRHADGDEGWIHQSLVW